MCLEQVWSSFTRVQPAGRQRRGLRRKSAANLRLVAQSNRENVYIDSLVKNYGIISLSPRRGRIRIHLGASRRSSPSCATLLIKELSSEASLQQPRERMMCNT